MVHGEYGVGVFEQKGLEQGVGGVGAAHVEALLAQVGERGFDNLDFFAAEVAAFTGVRVEAGHQNARCGDAEFVLQIVVQDTADAAYFVESYRVGHLAQRQVGGHQSHP